MNINDVLKVLPLMKPVIPLDAPIKGDVDCTLSNIIVDESVDIEREVDRKLLKIAVSNVLKHYSLWERQVIILRYGLDGMYPMTRNQIGKLRNCSQQYVQQTEVRVLNRLRNNRALKSYYDEILA